MRRFAVCLAYSVCMIAASGRAFAEDVVPAPAPAVDTVVAAAQPSTETPAANPVASVPAAATVRVPDLTGEWCGSWQSCVNGRNGPMRATFCRLCNGNYKVTFTGRFCKLIPFRYSTELHVTGYTDGVVYLSGSQSLGPVFGTFTYNAWANERQFASGYTANKDQGQFNLSR